MLGVGIAVSWPAPLRGSTRRLSGIRWSIDPLPLKISRSLSGRKNTSFFFLSESFVLSNGLHPKVLLYGAGLSLTRLHLLPGIGRATTDLLILFYST